MSKQKESTLELAYKKFAKDFPKSLEQQKTIKPIKTCLLKEEAYKNF